ESSVLYRCGATQRAAVVMRLAIMGSGAPVQRWMPEAGREGPAAESTAGRHGATAHHSTETRGAGRGLAMTTIKVCAWHRVGKSPIIDAVSLAFQAATRRIHAHVSARDRLVRGSDYFLPQE